MRGALKEQGNTRRTASDCLRERLCALLRTSRGIIRAGDYCYTLFDHRVTGDAARKRSCSLFVGVLFLSGMVVRGGARIAPPLAKLRLAPLATMTAAHSGVTRHTHAHTHTHTRTHRHIQNIIYYSSRQLASCPIV